MRASAFTRPAARDPRSDIDSSFWTVFWPVFPEDTEMSINTATTHASNRNWSMAAAEALPDPVFAAVYRHRTGYTLTELPTGRWRLDVDGDTWLLPRAKDALRLTHIGDRPHRRVVEKYIRGPISVQRGDRVVDVGAMIGEFSRQLPTDDVLALDVDYRNVDCLRHNISGEVARVGLWCSDQTKTLTLGPDTSESSLLGLDTGNGEESRTAVARLDSLLTRPVDLLKVEAEGAEPEVLQGAAGVEAKQVVVDVSPERNGQSPAPLCRSLLADRGYHVERYDDVLTAIQTDEPSRRGAGDDGVQQ